MRLLIRTNIRSQRGGVFTLLLGLLFLAALGAGGYAYYLYMQEHETLQATQQQLQFEVAEKEGLKIELDEVYQLKVRVESELAQTNTQLETVKEELAKTIEAKTSLAQAVEARQNEIDRLAKELGQVSSRAQEVTAQLTALQEDKNSAQSRISELQTENEALEARVSELFARPTVELEKVVVSSASNETSKLSFNNELFNPVSSRNALSDASSISSSGAGEIIVVNREYEFVVMNLGKNHGLSIGQEFQILRGNEILGRVKVEKVYDELSAATILPDSLQGKIREGDGVKAL